MPLTIEGVRPSAELRAEVSRLSGRRCVLAFSRGKDSIALWLALREHFSEIIPLHYDMIPGLRFVDESVAYYEQAFGTKIHRVPNPMLFRWLRANVYQPPRRVRQTAEARMREWDYDEVRNLLSWRLGHDRVPWYAVGYRAADNISRRTACKRSGGVFPKRLAFWGIWDWTKREVLDSIAAAGIALPPDYDGHKRSLDGIHGGWLAWMRDRYPDDYATVLEWFPLADIQFVRSPWFIGGEAWTYGTKEERGER